MASSEKVLYKVISMCKYVFKWNQQNPNKLNLQVLFLIYLLIFKEHVIDPVGLRRTRGLQKCIKIHKHGLYLCFHNRVYLKITWFRKGKRNGCYRNTLYLTSPPKLSQIIFICSYNHHLLLFWLFCTKIQFFAWRWW